MLFVVVLLTYRSVPWSIWHDKPVVTIEGIRERQDLARVKSDGADELVSIVSQ